MNMKWTVGISGVIGLVILTLGLTLVFTGFLGTENPNDTTKLASALITSGNGTSEGIQVHGDWVIEVHDPDGALVEKREFENEFTGAEHISKILSRQARPGLYRMFIFYNGGILTIHEPTDLPSDPEDGGSNTLTVSAGGAGVKSKLVLQSEFDITVDWSAGGDGIDRVVTTLSLCDGQTNIVGSSYSAPDFCDSTDDYFSDKILESPVNAIEGQKVTITVEFTFD